MASVAIGGRLAKAGCARVPSVYTWRNTRSRVAVTPSHPAEIRIPDNDILSGDLRSRR